LAIILAFILICCVAVDRVLPEALEGRWGREEATPKFYCTRRQ